MNEKAWYESYFGEDYFEIYEDAFPVERTAAEVDGICSLLDLEAGAQVLDVACGHGRHAILLAKRGYVVTGYDLSSVFLERARVEAEKWGASVQWIRGDMRELSFEAEFDAAINIFTSFGYFEDPKDDVMTLRGIRKALRPGGKLLLEVVHRDGLIHRLQNRTFDRTSSGSVVLRERHWDPVRDVIDENVTKISPDGSRVERRTSVRMRSLSQFLVLMHEAGLESETWCGGLDGSPLEPSSRRLVLVCRRSE